MYTCIVHIRIYFTHWCDGKALCSAAVAYVKINLWIDVRMDRTSKKIAMEANVSMFRSLSPEVIGPEF